jgi:hypothetical protein
MAVIHGIKFRRLLAVQFFRRFRLSSMWRVPCGFRSYIVPIFYLSVKGKRLCSGVNHLFKTVAIRTLRARALPTHRSSESQVSYEPLWPRGGDFPRALPSAVISTVDPPLGTPSLFSMNPSRGCPGSSFTGACVNIPSFCGYVADRPLKRAPTALLGRTGLSLFFLFVFYETFWL